MARRRTRTYIRRPLRTIKYSNETFNFNAALNIPANSNPTYQSPIVLDTNIGGTRKIKNLSLSIMAYSRNNDWAIPFVFAVIYYPEQTGQEIKPPVLNVGGTINDQAIEPLSIYEPNQNVIMSGFIPTSSNTPVTFRSRLARNLNSGDTVLLLLRPIGVATEALDVDVAANFNYAICYN